MFTDHQIPLARLDKSRKHEFRYVPTPEELDSLSQAIGFRRIVIETFKGVLTPISGGVDLHAKLIGQATQNCVISGAPVHTRLNHNIIRKYRRDMAAFETDIAHEDDFDDTYDQLLNNLELNDLLSESIILFCPEYPKLQKYLTGEEWSISVGDDTPEVENERPNPFAELNDKLFGKKSEES